MLSCQVQSSVYLLCTDMYHLRWMHSRKVWMVSLNLVDCVWLMCEVEERRCSRQEETYDVKDNVHRCWCCCCCWIDVALWIATYQPLLHLPPVHMPSPVQTPPLDGILMSDGWHCAAALHMRRQNIGSAVNWVRDMLLGVAVVSFECCCW